MSNGLFGAMVDNHLIIFLRRTNEYVTY